MYINKKIYIVNEKDLICFFYQLAELVIKKSNYTTHCEEQYKDKLQELVFHAFNKKDKYNNKHNNKTTNQYSFFFKVMQRKLITIERKEARRNNIVEIVYSNDILK